MRIETAIKPARARIVELAPALLPSGLVAGVGLDGGGYAATTWGWSTVAPLAVVLAALGLGAARRPSALASLFLALVGGLLAWTLLSVVWSSDVSQSMLDAERTLVYLRGFGEIQSVPSGHAARPEPASSVAPIALAIDAPCVLGSERASRPDDERYSAKPS